MAGRRRCWHRVTLLAGAALFSLVLSSVALAGETSLIKFPNSRLEPVAWTSLEGWADDDHLAAFNTFMVSCKAILQGVEPVRAARPVYGALREVCKRASAAKLSDAKEAREFFEQNFRPVRISPLADPNGFVTGYYEPVVDGSLQPTEEFAEPMYRRPDNLLSNGRMMLPGSTAIIRGRYKRINRARYARFYDRDAIEKGALAGRNLEICYLKDPIDAFFIQIQGSARVRLSDGKMLRLSYAGQNGHPYAAVGRFLIERQIVPKEEMSMDRIRQWMTANPVEAVKLRNLNRSYVFFRETPLANNEEAIGAQGVSLTPGRSIAVDRNQHVYGTPFFIQAELPIESEQPTTKFRRLMVAQDTGGAIVGVARADIYFGAGDEAGRISGRLKNPARFVMLFPNEIDPVVASADAPLPTPRPADVPAATAVQPEAKPAAVAPAKPVFVARKPVYRAAYRRRY